MNWERAGRQERNYYTPWVNSSRTIGPASSSSLLQSVCSFLSHNALHISNSVSTDQVAAAIEGYFWPKIFWDFLTKNLDGAVKPIPVLQTINLISGLVMLAWEWPLGFLAGTAIHRSIEARLVALPMCALVAALMYQATNPAIYYVIGMGVYFWAYSEGEVCLILSQSHSLIRE